MESIPICYDTISKHQWADPHLKECATKPNYKTKKIGKCLIIFTKDDIMPIPMPLRNAIIAWYHINLCHPGLDRTEKSILRNFTWPGLREDIRAYIQTCDACQRLKKHTQKYGEIPAKSAEAKPWQKLCVDLIGPYKVQTHDGKIHILHALTMIDPATSWFEIVEITTKDSESISLLVDREWLCRYPRPLEVSFDQGGNSQGGNSKTY